MNNILFYKCIKANFKEILERKGYAYFDKGQYNVNIIGIRNCESNKVTPKRWLRTPQSPDCPLRVPSNTPDGVAFLSSDSALHYYFSPSAFRENLGKTNAHA